MMSRADVPTQMGLPSLTPEEQLKHSMESVQRVAKRPNNPPVMLRPPEKLDPETLVLIDFSAMDRACLPTKTTQVCMALASTLARRVQVAGIGGNVQEMILVRPDGRLLGLADSSNGERVALEEFWEIPEAVKRS